MPKIDNKFTAHFVDTTTAPGTPITGLSPTINIRETNGSLVVDEQPLVELGGGHYMYTFGAYNAYQDYIYDINPNDDRVFIQSGVTTDGSLNKALAEINGGIGGGFSSQSIQNSITNAKNALEKKIESISQIDTSKIEKTLGDIDSHIELAKDEIISNIPTIEKSDFTPVVKKIETVDKKITKYIESEQKDKEEIGMIARELNKLDLEEEKMRKMKEKEEKKREEEEMKKQKEQEKIIIEEIKKEFERQEEEDKKERKKELEQELKETLKEAEEIKKELNSL